MDKVEKIKRMLEGKTPIFIQKLTIDNAENNAIILDPAGRKIVIEQILVNNGIDTTGTLDMRLYPTFPDGAAPELTDYSLTIPIGECQNVLAGDSLEIDRPMTLTAEDSINENKTYTVEVRWSEKQVVTEPITN